MNKKHKIILVRHSETVWNEQLRYIGRTDMELSPLGKKHALMLANFLADVPLRFAYSSTMRRARETAALVAAGRAQRIRLEPELREIDFGEWEGLNFSEISSAYSDLADIWVEDPFSVRIPGGEPIDEFVSRVREAWMRIRKEIIESGEPQPGEKTIIITHAGCIKIILGQILGLSDRKIWQTHQEKGSLNHVAVSLEGDIVESINDIAYRDESTRA